MRKELLQKKAIDKWNVRWFLSMPVLLRWGADTGGKAGRKSGPNTYKRSGCKGCRQAFRKIIGYKNHQCKEKTSSYPPRP